eukprot:gene1737-506_t
MNVKKLYGVPQATVLLPHLILGSKYDLLEEGFIEKHNIKYILCVANECKHDNIKIPKSIEQIHIKIDDTKRELETENMINFQKCVDFIEKTRPKESKKGEILVSETCFVHCMRGRSRSSSVVMAYLMKNYNLTLKEAYLFVKERRPFVGPHEDLRPLMISLEKIWFEKNTLSENEWNDFHDSFARKKTKIEQKKEALIIKDEKDSINK